MAETFATEMKVHIAEVHAEPANKLMRDTTELVGDGGQKYSDANQAGLLAAILAFDPACEKCQAFEGNPDPIVEPEEVA
jgi:hypothetical protein